MTCGEAAADLDEQTKQIFMNAVGVEDYQEIALLQDWVNRVRVEVNMFLQFLFRYLFYYYCYFY